MNPINLSFQRVSGQGKKAFIPFLTAGDPNLEATERLVPELIKSGADLIEIGFPYSDPIADGSVIQASYTRALENGLRIDDIFKTANRLTQAKFEERRSKIEKTTESFKPQKDSILDPPSSIVHPLVAMVSYSLVQHRGSEKFLKQAQDAGFSGAIVPDLPVEESGEISRIAADLDFKLIQLVTPTTPRDRAVLIADASTGFLYCVSVTGITGEREKLPDELLGQIAWLRRQTDLPICVGFGISKPEHVKMLRDVADGVIVGSALVRKLEQAKTRPMDEVAQEICGLVRTLSLALNPLGGSDQ